MMPTTTALIHAYFPAHGRYTQLLGVLAGTAGADQGVVRLVCVLEPTFPREGANGLDLMTADRTGTVSLALLGLSGELHVLKLARQSPWTSMG